eukprot:358057-Chlamydomonas_euryale.AAC.5
MVNATSTCLKDSDMCGRQTCTNRGSSCRIAPPSQSQPSDGSDSLSSLVLTPMPTTIVSGVVETLKTKKNGDMHFQTYGCTQYTKEQLCCICNSHYLHSDGCWGRGHPFCRPPFRSFLDLVLILVVLAARLTVLGHMARMPVVKQLLFTEGLV